MRFLPELDEDGHFKKQPLSKKRVYKCRVHKKHFPSWQHRRRAYFKKHTKVCKLCCSRLQVELHHIRYTKRRGSEQDGDLVPLCRWHHLDFHERYGSSKDMTIEWAIYFEEARR